jgi:hypothetical protein
MTDNHSQHASLMDAMRTGEFTPHIDELHKRASQGDDVASIALGHIYFRGMAYAKITAKLCSGLKRSNWKMM